jgi:hypothetical protein
MDFAVATNSAARSPKTSRADASTLALIVSLTVAFIRAEKNVLVAGLQAEFMQQPVGITAVSAGKQKNCVTQTAARRSSGISVGREHVVGRTRHNSPLRRPRYRKSPKLVSREAGRKGTVIHVGTRPMSVGALCRYEAYVRGPA